MKQNDSTVLDALRDRKASLHMDGAQFRDAGRRLVDQGVARVFLSPGVCHARSGAVLSA